MAVRKRRQDSNDSLKDGSGLAEYEQKQSNENAKGCANLLLRVVCAVIFTTLALLSVAWAISPINPVDIVLPELPAYEGALRINNAIEKGVKIVDGIGRGPESTAIDSNGNLYTGFVDGRVVKVGKNENGEIGKGEDKIITDGIVPGVDPIDDKFSNGRPLGIRLQEKLNLLYVIDGHYGLYALSLEDYSKQPLVKPGDVEQPMKFPNDLTLSQDGNIIYFTDSSSVYSLERLGLEVVEGTCNGRVFKYDLTSEDLDLIASNLCMANGIQLVANDTTLVVAETSGFRVTYIDIATKRIKKHVYLPAMPDNIRPSAKENRYWVSCCIRNTPTILKIMSSKFVRKLLGITNTPFIYGFYDFNFGLAVEIDENGNIVSSLHDHKGIIGQALSEVTLAPNGDLILSTFYAPHLIKISKKDL